MLKRGFIIFIFARGGSKGVPNKNIASFADKPLIAWAIMQAKSVEGVVRVIVSTDSTEIAEVARAYGADVPFIRPKELAEDSTPEIDAWRHAIKYLKKSEKLSIDFMISMPTTAPLRSNTDIELCITEFLKGDFDVVLTGSKSETSPYFNMVKIKNNECAELAIKTNNLYTNRQDAPTIYSLSTAVYVVRTSFILDQNVKSIFQGSVKVVEIPQERSIDIDTIYDFEIAEFLMRKKIENANR